MSETVTKVIAFLLTLKVNSEQELSHMEPDSAACIKVPGEDGYVSDRNAVLNKPMVGFKL